MHIAVANKEQEKFTDRFTAELNEMTHYVSYMKMRTDVNFWQHLISVSLLCDHRHCDLPNGNESYASTLHGKFGNRHGTDENLPTHMIGPNVLHTTHFSHTRLERLLLA
jgi:hypothetical protein